MTTQTYGRTHTNLRQAWLPHVMAGHVTCRKCGQLIQPQHPRDWDLGHPAPQQPEHIVCNRRDGAIRGNQQREPRSQAWY